MDASLKVEIKCYVKWLICWSEYWHLVRGGVMQLPGSRGGTQGLTEP